MGAAPPPGGNGWGNSGGGGDGIFRNQFAVIQESGRYIIKVFTNGSATPFTGLTDPGGYFFVPFIPEGEPFTAIAIDTVTGDTRSFDGVGPETGDSVYMFFDFFNEEEQPFSISWDGGGDGVSWHDPLNWDTDDVPNSSDRVLIDVLANITVTHSTGNTTVISVQSEEVLNISGGSLTVQAASTVNNNFMMGNRTNLTASGNGVSFTVNGSGNINGANLFAENGGVISMPQITDYNGYTGSSHTTWRADGSGSSINLPGITTLTGNAFPNTAVIVEALAGGTIDLSGVVNIDGGHTHLSANGLNSDVDLSALTTFMDTGNGSSSIAVNDNATI